jgi:hypothetical protein
LAEAPHSGYALSAKFKAVAPRLRAVEKEAGARPERPLRHMIFRRET